MIIQQLASDPYQTHLQQISNYACILLITLSGGQQGGWHIVDAL